MCRGGAAADESKERYFMLQQPGDGTFACFAVWF